MNQYLENASRFCWGPEKARLNPDKVKLLDRYAVGSVIDIGCGSGIYSNYLAKNGHVVVGVDNQLSFINSARKRFSRAEFRLASATHLPFNDGHFDTALLFDIIEHLDDMALLREAKRVAKRIIISVPHENQRILEKYSLVHQHYLDTTHLRNYSVQSLRNMLQSLKLNLVYLEPALPISLHGLFIEHLSRGDDKRKFLLKLLLKPFMPEDPICSSVFAVAEKRKA